ncbi:MAG: glutamate cyclase domain-containing protein [Candidatus Ranarchaeia archaeon]|jgi:hypothetical protein
MARKKLYIPQKTISIKQIDVDELMSKSTQSVEYALSQALDRIANSNFNGRNSYLLYDYYLKEKLQGIPLSLFAARKTLARVQPKTKAIILTGFPVANKLETDGPFGSAALIKTLNVLEVECVVVTAPQLRESLALFYSKIGLTDIRVVSLPLKEREGLDVISALFNEINPQMIIAIEVPGRNIKNQAHNMKGENISLESPNFDEFFLKARETGILTVAIGDGGNELGMGGVIKKVQEFIPFGNRCVCGCGGGIASEQEADALVIASVSNWGAYAFAGVLSFLSGIHFPHTAIQEREYILLSSELGLVDGFTGKPSTEVDGVSMDLDISIVDFLVQSLRQFQGHK